MRDWILLIIILIIPALAQLKVTSTYARFKKVKSEQGLSGQEVARKILDANGLSDVYVVMTRGSLTDHYDPSRKVVRLSNEIYEGTSIAALSVAAHECGHAIQDKEGYLYMRIRSIIYPVVNIGTTFSYIIILLGALFQMLNLIYIGIALVGLGLIFQLITLPVEFNASKRAGEQLKKLGLASPDESRGVKTMLSSAAMTYVAGVLASALQILRLLLIFGRRD